MGRVAITGYGAARHHPEDDSWTFPAGSPEAARVEAGEVVGFRYRVTGRGEARVDTAILFHGPDEPAPAPAFTTVAVEAGQEYFRNVPPPEGFHADGRPVRATFVVRAGQRGAPVTASVLLRPGVSGRAPGDLAAASDVAVTAFEARFDTVLRPDYRAFVRDVNGVDLAWWRDPAWPGRSSAFIDALTELEPAVRRDLGAAWEGPSDLYGIGSGHPQLDLLERDELYFYRPELMRHAYVVGVDGGGNNFVQVARGRHAGRILGVDHEVYYGGLSTFVDFEDLDEAARADLPWTDIAEADTDAVIDKAEAYGFLYPITDGFARLYEREMAVARALQDALAPEYRRA